MKSISYFGEEGKGMERFAYHYKKKKYLFEEAFFLGIEKTESFHIFLRKQKNAKNRKKKQKTIKIMKKVGDTFRP